MRNKVFLDTSYVVALTIATDQFHEKALSLSEQLPATGARILTTQRVLLEVGNSLSKSRYRLAAVKLLRFLTTDPTFEVVALNSDLLERGIRLFEQRPDKEWGLVDCISFIVMTDRGLTDALTSDEHFEQAGFVALLRQ